MHTYYLIPHNEFAYLTLTKSLFLFTFIILLLLRYMFYATCIVHAFKRLITLIYVL